MFLSQALPYFSATVKSTRFMEQIVMKVLPHYYLLPELTGQEVSVQDQVCKLAAELAVFMDKLCDPATAASNVSFAASQYNTFTGFLLA